MRDGRDARRRVITARGAEGEDVHIVFQVGDDGYVSARIPTTVKLDAPAISKTVEALRDLQAIALRGVQWKGIV